MFKFDNDDSKLISIFMSFGFISIMTIFISGFYGDFKKIDAFKNMYIKNMDCRSRIIGTKAQNELITAMTVDQICGPLPTREKLMP